MRISALHTSRLVSEFRRDLQSARIRKLRKSEKDKMIIIHLESGQDRFSLIFHFGGRNSYLYMLDGLSTRIATTNFLPQLIDSEILNINQIGFDRIVEFNIKVEDQEKYRLIFELFGISSNIYLTDSSLNIITSIRKAKLDLKKYESPNPPKLYSPLNFDSDLVLEEVKGEAGLVLRDAILKLFSGLDSGLLEDASGDRSNYLDLSVTDIPSAIISEILDDLNNYCNDFINPKTALTYNPESESIIIFADNNLPRFQSISEIFRESAHEQKAIRPKSSVKSDIAGQLKRAIKKDAKKAVKLGEQLEKAENYLELNRKAELLGMNLHRAKKGMESIEVEDVYSDKGKVVIIDLDQSLSPGQNVERLYERAKKLREKIPGIKEEIRLTKDRLKQLEEIKTEIDKLKIDVLPEDLKNKLAECGIKVSGKSKREEPRERLPYKKYLSSLGEEILVGRSAADNDLLTFKFARKYDLWLHSQQTSGSHVILRRPNRNHQFQKSSIVEAAEIAAFFSTAKKSETVPVIYTEVKYVRKVRKGRPGQVLADRTKSILVAPRRPKN